MIIGRGDIAKALREVDRPEIVFFASGVSNSQETDEKEYEREMELIENMIRVYQGSHFVYFSTLSLFYKNSRYTEHKRLMERYIMNHAYKYTIVRLGNIDWGTNPHTIINTFRRKKENGEKIVIEDTYRYVVSLEEFQEWMRMIPLFSCEMNIPGQRMTVRELYDKYVKI